MRIRFDGALYSRKWGNYTRALSRRESRALFMNFEAVLHHWRNHSAESPWIYNLQSAARKLQIQDYINLSTTQQNFTEWIWNKNIEKYFSLLQHLVSVENEYKNLRSFKVFLYIKVYHPDLVVTRRRHGILNSYYGMCCWLDPRRGSNLLLVYYLELRQTTAQVERWKKHINYRL